jgi:hypothetical protein
MDKHGHTDKQKPVERQAEEQREELKSRVTRSMSPMMTVSRPAIRRASRR